MWVLSRKKNEQLVIGDDIFVTVIEIRGDKVRLGIEHPKEVPVHRLEVYEAIRRNEAQPAGSITAQETAGAPLPPAALAPAPVDKVGQLAAALQAHLGVAVSRELVSQALREAGLEELKHV